MDFIKNIFAPLVLCLAVLGMSPSTMAAKPMGKIENKTAAETEVTIDNAIEKAEETLAAIKNGTEKDAVMALYKETKQLTKEIESTVIYLLRQKALERLSKSRSAFKKGKVELAEEKMVEALEKYNELKNRYHSF